MDENELSTLEARRHAFDKKRTVFLDRLEMLTHEQLTERPSADRWSLLQVAQHLVLGEYDVLQYLPDPERLAARTRTLRDRVMSVMVLVILRLGIRVKVPAAAMEPDGNTTLEVIRRDWDRSQAWQKSFIASLASDEVDLAVFHHPVSGALTMAQALTLADVHFDSHVRKIDDRLRMLTGGST